MLSQAQPTCEWRKPLKTLSMSILFATAITASVSAFADNQQAFSRIYEGIYISAAEPNRACVVIVKNESTVFNKDRYTVEVAQQGWSIYPDLADYAVMSETSDPFSLEELKSQALKNSGQYVITTKKSASTSNSVSGRISESDGAIFWDVRISKSVCIGLCTGGTASCTVRLK